MQHFFVELFVRFAGSGFEGDFFVAEESEVVDEDAGSLLEGILGEDCAVGGDFENELVVVGLLVNAEILDCKLDVLDGSINRVDEDFVDFNGLVVFPCLFGVLVGIPVLRLSGDYLAIVTLAFGEIVKNVMNACYLGLDSHGLHFSLKDTASLNMEVDGKVLINGAMGITGIKKASTFTIGIVLVIITLLVILNLVNSRAGRAIKAIRDNEIAARSVGIPITKYKLMAFVTSAVFAGVAGVLYALNYSSLVAKKFDYNTSILILVFVVLGGIGNLRGSVIAAAVLTVLPELLRSMNDYRMLIYAIVLIVVMIFNQSPEMIALRKRLTARFRKEDAEGKGAKDKEKKGVA